MCGANAVIVHPTFNSPIISVLQAYNVHNSVDDDQISEFVGFEA